MLSPFVKAGNSNDGHRWMAQRSTVHVTGHREDAESKNERSVLVLKYSLAVLTAAAMTLMPVSGTVQARSGGEWFALPVETQTSVKIVEFTPRMGQFKQVALHASNGDVYVESVELFFGKAGTRTYQIESWIKNGITGAVVDLPGRSAAVRRAEIKYRSSKRSSGVVTVFGLVADPPGDFKVLETVRVDTKDRETRLRLDGGERPVASIRLRAWGDALAIKRADIVFGNGERQRVRIRDRLEPGEMTKTIDLLGYERHIKYIALRLRPQRGVAEVARIDLLGKRARRGYRRGVWRGAATDGWNLLGRRKIALFGKDADVFRVGGSQGRYVSILARARDQDVRMYGMTIVYGNGEREDVPMYGRLAAGESTPPYKLKGRRYIDYIKFQYRTRLNFRGSGEIELWGKPRKRGRR